MNTLLTALPENEHARLSAHLETVALAPGQVLYEPDEPISHVYFPDGAVLSLLAMDDSGDAVEVGTIGNEGTSGLPILNGMEWVRFPTNPWSGTDETLSSMVHGAVAATFERLAPLVPDPPPTLRQRRNVEVKKETDVVEAYQAVYKTTFNQSFAVIVEGVNPAPSL